MKKKTFGLKKIFTKVQEQKKITMSVKIIGKYFNWNSLQQYFYHAVLDFPENELISHFYVRVKNHQNISK